MTDMKKLTNAELLELIVDARIEFNRRTLIHGEPLPYNESKFNKKEWNTLCDTMKDKFKDKEPLKEDKGFGDGPFYHP